LYSRHGDLTLDNTKAKTEIPTTLNVIVCCGDIVHGDQHTDVWILHVYDEDEASEMATQIEPEDRVIVDWD
jgi:hypothetical protein